MGNVKKPNKAARMKKKAEHAETFNKSFSYGYGMGYNQAIDDMERGKPVAKIAKKKGFYQ